MTDVNVHACRESGKRPRYRNCSTDADDKGAIIARCRLAQINRVFTDRGWTQVPDTERGHLILQMCADLAWLAGPENPRLSVHRYCTRWASSLFTPEQIDEEIVDYTADRHHGWTSDQIGVVLEHAVADRERLRTWQLGVCDDPDGEKRAEIRRRKNTARKRKGRAGKSTGKKRGRPKKEQKEWQLAGYSSERTYYRHKARGAVTAQNGSEIPSRHISNNRSRDAISLPTKTQIVLRPAPAAIRRAPQARRRLAPPCEVLEGEIILDDDDSGVALRAPPPIDRGRFSEFPIFDHPSLLGQMQVRWQGPVIDQYGNPAPPPERRSPPGRKSNMQRGREMFGGIQ